jgi:hypothetical protein
MISSLIGSYSACLIDLNECLFHFYFDINEGDFAFGFQPLVSGINLIDSFLLKAIIDR